MVIDISRDYDGNFEFIYEDAAKDFIGYQARLTAPVKVSGEFHKSGEDYLVIGNIRYSVIYDCAKCLAPVAKSYNLEFNELFSCDNEDGFIISEDKIDLTPLVDENIVLNIDYRVLCTEDCKGLCPECGTNLNINSCKCKNSIEEISGENPFAVLRDITGGAEDGSTKKKNIKTKTQHESR